MFCFVLFCLFSFLFNYLIIIIIPPARPADCDRRALPGRGRREAALLGRSDDAALPGRGRGVDAVAVAVAVAVDDDWCEELSMLSSAS